MNLILKSLQCHSKFHKRIISYTFLSVCLLTSLMSASLTVCEDKLNQNNKGKNEGIRLIIIIKLKERELFVKMNLIYLINAINSFHKHSLACIFLYVYKSASLPILESKPSPNAE